MTNNNGTIIPIILKLIKAAIKKEKIKEFLIVLFFKNKKP